MSISPFIGLIFVSLLSGGVHCNSVVCSTENQKRTIRLGDAEARFVIGWPFALHDEQCKRLRVEAVHELIAAQWALSFWNQQQHDNRNKLALSIFDTCSTENGFTKAVMSLLEETAFYALDQCQGATNRTRLKPLGLMISPRTKRREDASMIIKSINMPLITYASEDHFTLRNSDLNDTFATVPSLENYIEVVTTILKETHNNLINIIYDADVFVEDLVTKIRDQLNAAQIHVYETISKQELTKNESPENPKVIKFMSNKSSVILTLVDYLSLKEILRLYDRLKAPGRIFISAPVGLTEVGAENPLPPGASSRLVLIRNTATSLSLVEFNKYFLDYMKRKQASGDDPLVEAYFQTQYDCAPALTPGTAGGRRPCGRVTRQEMSRRMIEYPASVIEPIILAIYAFGSALTALQEEPRFKRCLQQESSPYDEVCLKLVSEALRHVRHSFDAPDDPSFLLHFNLRFDESHGSLTGSMIRASHVTYGAATGRLVAETIAEYVVGYSRPIVYTTATSPKEQLKWRSQMLARSTCSYGLAECTKCSRVAQWPGAALTGGQNDYYDLYLLGLFDLNHWDKEFQTCVYKPEATASVKRPELAPLAFVYTLETLKRKYADLSVLRNVRLTGVVADGCRSSRRAALLVADSLASDCVRLSRRPNENVTVPMFSVAALVSGQSETQYDVVRRLFVDSTLSGDLDIPVNNVLLLGSTPDPAPGPNFFNELVTMPDYSTYAQVLIKLLTSNRWDYFTAIISDHDFSSLRAFEVFKTIANENQLCIAEEVRVRFNDNFAPSDRTASRKPSTKVVVLFTTPQDTVSYLKVRRSTDGSNNNFIYVFSSESVQFEEHLKAVPDTESRALQNQILGSVAVQPALNLDRDFIDFYSKVDPQILPEPWFVSYWEQRFQCSWSNSQTSEKDGRFKKTCDKGARKVESFGTLPNAIKTPEIIRTAYMVHALESLVFAMDAIYKRLCPEQSGLCEEFFEQYHDLLFDFTRKLPKMDRFTIYGYKPLSMAAGKFEEVGNWSPKDGFFWSAPLVWYPEPSDPTINSSLPESSCRPPLCRCRLPDDFFAKPVVEDDASKFPREYHTVSVQEALLFNDNLYDGVPIKMDAWKKQPWSYVALTLVSLLLFCSLGVLALVVIKLLFGVIKGNQSLGICLLTGVALLFITCYFFIFDADPTTCRLRYFGHSLAYCLCFGVMIAKACQLHNGETLGPVGYISFWNYWLLLFFIVAVQVALNLQWIFSRIPTVRTLIHDTGSDYLALKCNWNAAEFVASQSYIFILLCLATFLAFVGRNVKRNYKETRFLLYTCSLCLPVWLIGCVLYLALSPRYQEPIVIGELVACGVIILGCMFGPKVYILLSYEPVLVEGLSSPVTLSKYNNARSVESLTDIVDKMAPVPEHQFDNEECGMPVSYTLFRGDTLFNNRCSTKSCGSQGTSGGSVRSTEGSINCPSDTAICNTAIRKKRANRRCKTMDSQMSVKIEQQISQDNPTFYEC